MGTGALNIKGALDDRTWLRGALSAQSVSALIASSASERVGQRLGPLASGEDRLRDVVAALTKDFPEYAPVRLVAFQKSDTKSWQVPWHQDRVIAVQSRSEVEGFENWSRKANVWHCEPAREVLDDMLFVRVFLDDCTPELGAMTFARQSHTLGKVASHKAAELAAGFEHETENAKAGDILVLPMLTLHKSDVGQTPISRRVLRIDLARKALPLPLKWRTAW